MSAAYRFLRYWGLPGLLWAALMATVAHAHGADLVLSAMPPEKPINLTPYWSVLEDTDQRWTIDDVSSAAFAQRFSYPRMTTDSLNFGMRTSAIWLRVKLGNAGRTELHRLLEVSYAQLQHVDLYIPAEGGFARISTGYTKPFAERPIDHRHFVFPLRVPPQSEATYYLRIASGTSLDIPARLWQPQAFHQQILREYMGQAVYVGMLLALGLYNLLLFVVLRDRTFLYYVLFVAASGFTMIAFSGIGFQFLWPQSPRWTVIASMVGFAATSATLLLFQQRLLSTRKTMPWLDRVMSVFVALNILQVFGFLLLPYHKMAALGTALDGTSMVLALVIGIVGLLRGQRSARFFLVAFSFLALAGVLAALRMYGVSGIPNFISVYGLQLGSALEMLLLSLALADRFNQIRREKETAQQQLVDSLKLSERMLEQRVSERTAELLRTNQELREHERALDAARSVAEEASRMKSAFLANMSHEIRTPMNAVIGMAYLALRTELTPQQRDYLEKIHRAAVSLLGIINDILDFSKIEAGKLTIEETDFVLCDVLTHVRIMTAERASEKDLDYLFDIGDDVPTHLRGDPLRLGQVLLNLLSNAIKFTPTGRVVLRCRVAAQSVTDVMLRFEVDDTGIGIPPRQQSKLFQAFSQADDSTTRKYGGTGLGLTISKRLVELMGGSMTLSSVVGLGSTFGFTLGFKRGTPFSASPQQPLRRALPRLEGKVLLVEDNSINEQIAREMLVATGLQVDSAANGRLALEKLFAAGPDAYRLVLMDMQMPEMGGLAAARRIRMDERFNGLPIIAMTAHAIVEERDECIRSGMQDHIAKPIHPDSFYQMLSRWLATAPADAAQGAAPNGNAQAVKTASLTAISVPGFDTAAALEQLAGDVDLYHKVLDMLVPGLAEAVSRLADALASGGEDNLQSVAHEVRGMALNVGATNLAEHAAQLERALKEHRASPEQIGAFRAMLEQTMCLVEQTLAHHRVTSAP